MASTSTACGRANVRENWPCAPLDPMVLLARRGAGRALAPQEQLAVLDVNVHVVAREPGQFRRITTYRSAVS